MPCARARRYSPGTTPRQTHDDCEWLKRGTRRAGRALERELGVRASPRVREAQSLARDSEQQSAETEPPRVPSWTRRPSRTDSIRVAAIARSNRRRQPVSAASWRGFPRGGEAGTRRSGITAAALEVWPASQHTAPTRFGQTRAGRRQPLDASVPTAHP